MYHIPTSCLTAHIQLLTHCSSIDTKTDIQNTYNILFINKASNISFINKASNISFIKKASNISFRKKASNI